MSEQKAPLDLDALERRAGQGNPHDVRALIAEARQLREKLGRAMALLYTLDSSIKSRHPAVAAFLDNEESQP